MAGRSDPAALVRGLLASLSAASDASDAAAALAAEAGDGFLARVGGERHLAHLLGNAAYAPLVGHRGAEVAPPERIDAAARITFTVRGRDDAHAGYLLSLAWHQEASLGSGGARPGGDAGRGRWRVTGLVRHELSVF